MAYALGDTSDLRAQATTSYVVTACGISEPEEWLLFVLPDDFMLLLCASLQRQIFEDENKAAVRIMAGDNVEICMNLDAASFSQHNPVPDFIHCR